MHAVVVGGSSGLGLAIGEALRARGSFVTNLARRAAPSSAADASFGCDVTSTDSVARAVSQARTHGPIDVLVYSSGAAAMGRTLDVPEADARRSFETTFWGLDRVVREVLPEMVSRRSGTVLVVSSLVALRAVPYQAYYAASKAAVARYLGCLSYEAGSVNVRVQALHVGFVDTGFLERGGWWGMDVPVVKGSGVTPADVARAAMELLDSGRDSMVLGWRERLIALGDRVAPTLYDRLLRLRAR